MIYEHRNDVPFDMETLGGLPGTKVNQAQPPQQKPPSSYKPIQSLDDLDVASELLSQLNNAKRMLHDALDEDGVPLNQKAQTVNSITTIIQQIAKTQTDIYNAERQKTLEGVLIAVLKEFPTIKTQFLTALEEALKGQ